MCPSVCRSLQQDGKVESGNSGETLPKGFSFCEEPDGSSL